MKIAALFPGYGSQFVGMAKGLYDESRLMQEHFEQAANCVDINFVKLCFASSDVEIAKMGNAYMSLFLVSSSIFDLLKEEGVEVDVVAGYNIGQYAALHAAGSLSLPDGLYLLNKYVKMYQEILNKGEYAFAKVFGIPSVQLQDLCKKVSSKKSFAAISVYESATEHIIAGHAPEVDKVCRAAVDLEGTTELVGPESGLHSSLMEPLVTPFKMYLEKVDFKDSSTSLLCASDAQVMRVGKDLCECAVNWITKPVLWAQIVDNFANYDLLIQVGPGARLRDMIKERYPDKKTIAINTRSDIKKLKMMMRVRAVSSET